MHDDAPAGPARCSVGLAGAARDPGPPAMSAGAALDGPGRRMSPPADPVYGISPPTR
ncbi:hypothetical protein BGLA2_1890032 [Burkholderia gladioli]|nr:hypothetical protein BGLA2_1890032 [Burkholderia gladioli]